jgi:hypothetical protein
VCVDGKLRLSYFISYTNGDDKNKVKFEDNVGKAA